MVLWFFRQSMIGTIERLMQLMNLIVQSHLVQYLRMRYELNHLISIDRGIYCPSLLVSSFHKFDQVITQIWVLLLGGLGLAGLLDVWVGSLNSWNSSFTWTVFPELRPFSSQAGHDFPIVFYLALGGSLLSYIYSAPPLKVTNKSLLFLNWIF